MEANERPPDAVLYTHIGLGRQPASRGGTPVTAKLANAALVDGDLPDFVPSYRVEDGDIASFVAGWTARDGSGRAITLVSMFAWTDEQAHSAFQAWRLGAAEQRWTVADSAGVGDEDYGASLDNPELPITSRTWTFRRGSVLVTLRGRGISGEALVALARIVDERLVQTSVA